MPFLVCITLTAQVLCLLFGSFLTGGGSGTETQTTNFNDASFLGIYAAIVVRDTVNYFVSSDRADTLMNQLAPSIFSGVTLALSRCGVSIAPYGVGRYLTWSISTPFLLYQLYLRSDSSVPVPYAHNLAMLACGMAAEAVMFTDPIRFVVASSASIYMWSAVAIFVFRVYTNDKNVAERNVILLSWSTYPAVFALRTAGLVSGTTVEFLYRICDVFAKVVGSSAVVVADKNRVMDKLMRRSDLLEEVIPPPFIEDILEKLPRKFILHDKLVVMFSDIVDYTHMSSNSSSDDVVLMLTNIFERFDDIIVERGLTKVETIGDAYMVVCVGSEAPSMISAASEMIRTARSINRPVTRCTQKKSIVIPTEHLRVRIGIHVGEAYSGVLTRLVPRYCYIGDTINTASRLQSGGEPMRIHISDALKALLETVPCQPRLVYELAGENEYKGKGVMKTWFVEVTG
jgi:class 3 adenylate cyclase